MHCLQKRIEKLPLMTVPNNFNDSYILLARPRQHTYLTFSIPQQPYPMLLTARQIQRLKINTKPMLLWSSSKYHKILLWQVTPVSEHGLLYSGTRQSPDFLTWPPLLGKINIYQLCPAPSAGTGFGPAERHPIHPALQHIKANISLVLHFKQYIKTVIYVLCCNHTA